MKRYLQNAAILNKTIFPCLSSHLFPCQNCFTYKEEELSPTYSIWDKLRSFLCLIDNNKGSADQVKALVASVHPINLNFITQVCTHCCLISEHSPKGERLQFIPPCYIRLALQIRNKCMLSEQICPQVHSETEAIFAVPFQDSSALKIK